MADRLSPYFSDTYEEARDKFRAAVNNNPEIVHSVYSHPNHNDTKGMPLTTDIAWHGSTSPKAILLISSGLHGIEGFAGSAIQLKALTEKALEPISDNLAIVYAHALNPYGFAHYRRVNEDNIDLNRNFVDWKTFEAQEHPLTETMQKIVAPDRWNWNITLAKTAFRIMRHKMSNVQAALQQGQYRFPQGLFYGGQDAAWSTNTVREIFSKCAENTSHIAHIDIHTGLGKYGDREMIITTPPNHPTTLRAIQWWGSEHVQSTTAAEDKSVSANVSGSIDQAFSPQSHEDCSITTSGLEFGTLPPLKNLKALAFDNWVHSKTDDPAQLQKAQQEMRKAFSPRDPKWENTILEQGIEVLQQASAGLKTQIHAGPKR